MEFVIGLFFLVFIDMFRRRIFLTLVPFWISLIVFVTIKVSTDVANWSVLGWGLILSVVFAAVLSIWVVGTSKGA